MLESEKEKVVLIAKTIEPIISMSHYLKLDDDIKQLSEQTLENNSLLTSIQVYINNEQIFSSSQEVEHHDHHVQCKIKDPITGEEIGILDIDYNLDDFHRTFDSIQKRIVQYLAVLALILSIFAFLIRRLLNPLREIAIRVKGYQPGSKIDFTSIKTDFETEKIIDAFNKMVVNIREHTILLERYKYAVDESNIVSKITLDGKISYVNNALVKVSGYSAEELLDKPYELLYHQNTDKKVFKAMWKNLQNGELWKGTIKSIHKNGKNFFVRTTVIPIFNDHLETVEYIAIGQDITEIVEKDEKLKLERKKLDDILNHIDNIVSMTTVEEKLLFINKKFFDFFPFESFEDLKQEHECVCELFVQKEGYLKKVINGEYWTSYIANNPNLHHKAIMIDKYGDEKIFDVKVQIINTNDQKLYVSTFSNITELERLKKEAEGLAKAKGEFLANMSHEIRTPMNGIFGFTKLLQKSALNKKQEHYVNVIDSSTRNLMGIINDILDFSKLESGKFKLDNISINPFIELDKILTLFSAKMDEKSITFNKIVEPLIPECIEIDLLRLQQIISNLLSNAVKFTPELGEISFYAKTIEQDDGTKKLRIGVQDNGIGISKNKQKHIFEAFSQADSSTTRKYGGTGLGLSISSSLVSLMGGELKLISEEGAGSNFFFDVVLRECKTEHSISKLFKNVAVHMVDDDDSCSTDRKIIQDYLEKLQINYSIVSKKDPIKKDAIYILFDRCENERLQNFIANDLNVVLVSDDVEPVNEKITHIKNIRTNNSELYNILITEAKNHDSNMIKNLHLNKKSTNSYNAKILVAEDNEINQMLISEILDSYKISYKIVHNGLEALNMLQTENFDLVLMDINMPVMGGEESVEKIKELGIKTPVVALTANAMEGDKQKYLSIGFDSYISKPIIIEELERIFSKYLSIKDQIEDDEIRKAQKETQLLGQKLVDMEKIRENLPLPEDKIKKLLNKYSSTIDDSFLKLKEATLSHNFAAMTQEAHSIKGSAGNLRFEKLRELAEVMEKESRIEADIDYISILDEIRTVIDRLKHEIAQITKE